MKLINEFFNRRTQRFALIDPLLGGPVPIAIGSYRDLRRRGIFINTSALPAVNSSF
jgi:hypothetical protein